MGLRRGGAPHMPRVHIAFRASPRQMPPAWLARCPLLRTCAAPPAQVPGSVRREDPPAKHSPPALPHAFASSGFVCLHNFALLKRPHWCLMQVLNTMCEEDLLQLGFKSGHARKFTMHLHSLVALCVASKLSGMRRPRGDQRPQQGQS